MSLILQIYQNYNNLYNLAKLTWHSTVLACTMYICKYTYLHDFNIIIRSDRTYPEGWTTDPGRDSSLEFRLSIINAVKEDSGIYRCETPARQSHQVEIIVEG